MTFAIPAAEYDRFMGRFSTRLAPLFASFAGVEADAPLRVLDVGCGPGALTHELVQRVGPGRVAAIDPAPQFAAACAERLPEAEVREGPAERLPWRDATFGASLAQLVVSFMADAPAGVREMRRVTAPGGPVALAMWADGTGLEVADVFWQAARSMDPTADAADNRLPYRCEASLRSLAEAAGLKDIEVGQLRVTAPYRDFADWWDSILHSAGPVGAYSRTLDAAELEHVREESRLVLGSPDGEFSLRATAWAARGLA